MHERGEGTYFAELLSLEKSVDIVATRLSRAAIGRAFRRTTETARRLNANTGIASDDHPVVLTEWWINQKMSCSL